eukprot:TRINITY_DN5782_c0_g1_i1.p1 TRINITY_DN5782_c0_g1~~TRINITY_DN5782_c0_g1_i1.p1  ORF type:complete len:524 (+),score=65.66 TRINITY_DN5782_c0_g1_i1:61-1632(+)
MGLAWVAAAVLLSAVLPCCVASPATHRVSGVRGLTSLWSAPAVYEPITLRYGDSLRFVYRGMAQLDVATVPSEAEFDACNVSRAQTLADSNGTVVAGIGQAVMDLDWVTYIWPSTSTGSFFFTTSRPGRCEGGQKLAVTVIPAVAAFPPVEVRVSPLPGYWTAGPQYSDLIVNVGDTLEFVSNSRHNVALVSAAAYQSCNASQSAVILSWTDLAPQVLSWTVTMPGSYYVVCGQATHCGWGQKFQLTVLPIARAVFPVQATSSNYWTTGRYPDLYLSLNDSLIFRYTAQRSNVVLLRRLVDLEMCNVSNPLMELSSSDGTALDPYGSASVTGTVVQYNWTLTTPGVFYVSCSLNNHCLTGKRFRVIVRPTATPPRPPVSVDVQADPVFWTNNLPYPNVTLSLGQSLQFWSDTLGTHDVSLVLSDTYQNKCAPGALEPKDIATQLFMTTSPGPYIWTPPALGTYYLVCSQGGGGHCASGQRFVVTVVASSPPPLVEVQDSAATSRANGPAVVVCLLSVLAALLA